MHTTTSRRMRRGLLASVVAAGALIASGPMASAAPVGASTTMTLTPSKANYVRGESAKFTVTLSKAAGQVKPTGDVTLYVDGEPLEVKALVSAKATFTTRLLSVGGHLVAAEYAGDATYGSTSLGTTVFVAQGATTTTIASRTEPVPTGKAAVLSTLSKRINPAAGGTLASTVDYTATPATGSPVTATVPAGSTGSSQWRPKLADGTWTITATYAGNNDFAGSEATPITVRVGVALTPRQVFEAASTGLVTEDFEDSADVLAGCGTNDLDSSSDNPCFTPGQIASGLLLRTASSGWALVTPDSYATPSNAIIDNGVRGPYEILFAAGHTAVGLDLVALSSYTPSGSCTVTAYDAGDAVVASRTVDCPTASAEPVFVGFNGTEAIVRINVSTVGFYPALDNVSFGATKP